jgi:hypothetical protein
MTKPRSVAATANDNSIPGSRIETGTIDDVKVANDAAIQSSKLSFIQQNAQAVIRSVRAKLEEGVVSVKDFGAVGDGIADDYLAVKAAADYANTVKKVVYAPAGTYRMTQGVRFYWGLVGDGQSNTLFQGVNEGTVKSPLISAGIGLYEGFTADGACSPDPPVFDSTNFDSFTGHTRTITLLSSDAVFRNVTSRNSVRAPFHADGRSRIIFESCLAQRGRGNFGDGYFFNARSQVTFINC